ncbi:MAG TPA: hypothetical protein VGR26_11125 [Acidimicrobiales bacterium]|nr:hypothetical protein [Acidimicrobiales bacterium]
MGDRWYACCEIWPWQPETLPDSAEKEELLDAVADYPALFSGGDAPVKNDPQRGRVLVLEDDQASYGVAQFDQTDGIPELCRALGLSYKLFDDGRYEYSGSEQTWVPGMGSPRIRSRLASGTVALSAGEFADLAEQADSDEELGQLVRAYFA